MKCIKDLSKVLSKVGRFIFRYIKRFFTPNRAARRKAQHALGLTRSRYPGWHGWWYRARRVART